MTDSKHDAKFEFPVNRDMFKQGRALRKYQSKESKEGSNNSNSNSEKKKKADAESRIVTLEKSLELLK